jgi:glycosyltransferase involved in cell wall biosynthesis
MLETPRRRLLVVSYNHPPSPGIAGTRWAAMTRYLREMGHLVTVVASNAWGVLPDDVEMGVVRVGDLRSLPSLRRLLRRGELRTHGYQGLERPPQALLTKVLVPEMNVVTWLPALAVTARRLLAQRSFDCLMTTSPPESSHLLGLLLGGRRPAWIADFRDGWTFEPYRDRFPTAAQRSLDLLLERHVCTGADVVTAATRPIAEDLAGRFGVAAQWVTNAWDPQAAPPSGPVVGSTKPSDRGALSLVYTGTLGGARNADPTPLFEAMKRVRAEDGTPLRFVHCGRLTTEERDLIERIGAADVFDHLGTLDRADAIALQRSADALVLITSRSSSEATGKIFEYVASSRPILALAEGNEAARIVEETNTGITVPPDDVAAIAAALRKVASGEIARDYAPRNLDRYMYPGPAERMAELVESAIERRNRTLGR